MNRDLVIRVFLIIAGIVLAIVLFGAGAMWRSRTPEGVPKTRSSRQRSGGDSDLVITCLR